MPGDIKEKRDEFYFDCSDSCIEGSRANWRNAAKVWCHCPGRGDYIDWHVHLCEEKEVIMYLLQAYA